MLLSFQRPSRPAGKVLPSSERSPARDAAGNGPISIALQPGAAQRGRVRSGDRRGAEE